MRENINMIKNMAMEYIPGQMEESTLECGPLESNFLKFFKYLK